mmetsp:Transcript_59206/g.183871  ORF Transcript_59206/g.183871 Transcript_59206/m.183871 type:complete len:134 (-) Transcript_59206:1054-1455(-)
MAGRRRAPVPGLGLRGGSRLERGCVLGVLRSRRPAQCHSVHGCAIDGCPADSCAIDGCPVDGYSIDGHFDSDPIYGSTIDGCAVDRSSHYYHNHHDQGRGADATLVQHHDRRQDPARPAECPAAADAGAGPLL